ncbi:RING-type E3 ubiquitin transferase [Quillaja saponaria]|uniref:RING-type E3 ubiquitin transferase n=1 Tax=Quillaja saponaria TaxID=32244 RepID=A0AAD7L2V5_QUISA|nr:RING-type E3 ubiquitin transferase [Quillaja saponaria]
MAKTRTVVADSDQTVVTKMTELKKELLRLVNAIVNDENYSTETIVQSEEMLCALKELKLKETSLSFKLQESLSCPDRFRCPLSKELMMDPVIVATGQTYDRSHIHKWIKAGNRTCPLTQKVLSHTVLIPNHLIRELIAQWCKKLGIELADPVHYTNEEGITKSEREHFHYLLEKMSSSLDEQKEAAKELRVLTRETPSFRALFGESIDAIPQLVNPLSGHDSDLSSVNPDLEVDIITTLYNASLYRSNKKLVAETPVVIPVLMKALRSGNIETRSNAAAAIFTLSNLDSNKELIGKSGALKLLIDLLEEGNPLVMRDVASAIFSLCALRNNRGTAVTEGAVWAILKQIMKGVIVEESVAMLYLLSNEWEAVEEMVGLEAITVLLSIINEKTSERNTENCISLLQTLCLHEKANLNDIREEEKKFRTISEIAQKGTTRAKRKAIKILERLNGAASTSTTHTA